MFDEYETEILSLFCIRYVGSGKIVGNIPFRLADVDETGRELMPFVKDSCSSRHFGNREELPFSLPMSEGECFFAEWRTTKNNNGVSDFVPREGLVFRKEFQVVGVSNVDQFTSLEQLTENIRTRLESRNAKIPVLYRLKNSEAVLCSPSDIEDGCLKSSVRRLPVYRVPQSEIVQCRGPNYWVKFLKSALGISSNPVRYVLISDRSVVLRQFLEENFFGKKQLKELGVSRKDANTLKCALTRIRPSLDYGIIANELCCSEQEAIAEVDKLFANIDKHINPSEVEADFVESILACDGEIAKMFRSSWEEHFAKDVETELLAFKASTNREKERILADIHEIAEKRRIAVASLEQEKKSLGGTLEGLRNSIIEVKAERERLQSEISVGAKTVEEIRSTISDLLSEKGELGRLLVMTRLVQCGGAPVDSNQRSTVKGVVSSSFRKGESLSVEQIESDTASLDLLCDNLDVVGVDNEVCSHFAAFLLAAYDTCTPLCVVGVGASSIADALSCAVVSRKADRLDCGEECSQDAIDKAFSSPDGILAVSNGVNSKWIDVLLRHARVANKLILFVDEMLDDIVIAPKGLFNQVVPVVADVFVKGIARLDESMYCGRVFNGEHSQRPKMGRIFTSSQIVGSLDALPRYKNLCKVVFESARAYDKTFSAKDECLCTFYAYALATGRIKAFSAVVSEQGCVGDLLDGFLEEDE